MVRRSTTLVDLRQDLEAAFRADPESLANPTAAAFCAITTIRKQWGGEAIYVPKEDDLDERDWKMWEMFDGTNYDEIGKAFDITSRQVRNRIRIIRPIAQAREQKGLFDDLLASAEGATGS